MLKCAATTMYFVCMHMRSFCQLSTNNTPAGLLNLLTMLQSLLMLYIMSIKIPQFCGAHKNATMVNVVAPSCTAEGCNLQASFALPPSKVSIKRYMYTSHKSPGASAYIKLRLSSMMLAPRCPPLSLILNSVLADAGSALVWPACSWER
jgi:EsV-1-7 cysteine-rich motif